MSGSRLHNAPKVLQFLRVHLQCHTDAQLRGYNMLVYSAQTLEGFIHRSLGSTLPGKIVRIDAANPAAR
jgi:hypothetical protein